MGVFLVCVLFLVVSRLRLVVSSIRVLVSMLPHHLGISEASTVPSRIMALGQLAFTRCASSLHMSYIHLPHMS